MGGIILNDIFKTIGSFGIVPVVKIEDAKNAVLLAKAFIKGGLNVIEITFRTAAAVESIKGISKEVPDMLTGAGTVTTI